jgi:Xaa-Pro aminopeptidase
MKRREIIVSLFGKNVETDAGDLRNEFARLRYSLLPDEVERYRRLGNDVADSFWEAAHLVHRGMTEHEMAAELSYRLTQRGISPLVLLAAADDRLSAYRHPLPSMNGLKSLALLSVCGRRHGLIVSASRLFSLGAVPGELRRRHRAVCEVSSWLMHHTVPGVKIADLFERLKERYRAVGFPDEWQLHHQGGATGYLVRDYRASPSSPEVVCSQQAFAWNPTIAGTKSEDTIIVTENGFEVLTADPRWPAVEVDLDGRIFHSPDILVLS